MFKRKGSKTTSPYGKDAGITTSPTLTTPSSPPLPIKSPPRTTSNKASLPPQSSNGTTGKSERRSSQGYAGPIDDFGRPMSPQQAFTSSIGSPQFGQGYGVGDEDDQTELQLLYGYTPLGTTMELSVARVGDIVSRCAVEIRKRGLDTPLILSSMALDISLEGSCSLIRSYMAGEMKPWLQDLALAAPLSVGAFLKWALGRLVNDQGGRGFLPWELYNSFKSGEKVLAYPTHYCTTNLVSRLPQNGADLLSSLLSLFSSVAAHSSKSGMTPRRLAGLFSPYIFGLSDDRPFDVTYMEWQRATDATEHVLLAFIRDEKATSGHLPSHLEKFVGGYPACLNVKYSPGAVPSVPKGGRVEEVTQVKRNTRFHSRNLISSAGSWEVQHSPDWQLILPSPGASTSSQQPAFTPQYRHLLNIRAHSLENDEDPDEGEMQRYKSVVEKEWGMFGENGFKDVEAGKLEFDLTENERSHVKAKHTTMDWGTFASSGFAGRETFAPTDLIFHQTLSHRVATWPASQQSMNTKLRETEKMLPPFPWDTTPHEVGRILVDVNFFEAWADVLVAGGWARDELKESQFALVQWKSRPRQGELPKGRPSETEDRSEERWVLVEEFVPQKYRDELRDSRNKKSSKRVSFLRAVRKKSTKSPSRLQISQPSYPTAIPEESRVSPYGAGVPTSRYVDDSVFHPGSDSTKIVSLSSLAIDRNSVSISTTGAAGHEMESLEGHGNLDHGASAPPPPVLDSPRMPAGVDGTMSSQKRESAFENGRGPVGYTKPVSPRGFLARIGTRSKKHPPLIAVAAPSSSSLSPSGITPQGLSPQWPATPRDSSLDTTRAGGHGSFAQPSSTNLGPSPTPPPPSSDDGSSIGPPPPPKSAGNTVYSDGEVSPTAASSEDPYDGIEDAQVQEGTVLFRGSRAYGPTSPTVTTMDGAVPSVAADGSPHLGAPMPVRRLPVTPPEATASSDPAGVQRPGHESLPPSPKPDAEVPVGEEFRVRDKFSSGASAFTSRVSNIVGLYETRDAEAMGKDVRLTHYGFNAPIIRESEGH